MFTWIQTTFKKHLPTFMVLLLVLLIIPFVFTIGAMPGLGWGDRKAKTLDVFGRAFTSESDRREFFEDGQLSMYLNSGRPSFDNNQVQFFTFRRAAALRLADELGIPNATQDDLTDFIKTLPAFTGPDGEYSAEAYTRFRDDLVSNPQVNEANIAEILRADWRVAEVEKILGGPGYVVDEEVKEAVAQADTTWSVVSATADLSDVEVAGEPSEEEISTWFETNAIRYRNPERVRVGYVEYPASDYALRVELTDDEVVKYFEANKARYRPLPPKVEEGETPPPPAEPTLEEARDRVTADLTRTRARTLAAKAAADFAYALFDKGIEPGTLEFDNELAANGLRLQSALPFAAGRPPPGTGWTTQIANEAFRLDERRMISDPLQTGDNTVIVFFEERIASADAELIDVRDRVVADLQADRKREAISARGEELRAQISKAVASGTSFVEAAENAGMETKTWADFTLRDPPQDIDYNVFGRIQDLSADEVSTMAVQGNSGSIVYIAKRDEPEIDTTSEDFTKAKENMMRQGSALTAQGVLAEMVQRELVAAGLADATE